MKRAFITTAVRAAALSLAVALPMSARAQTRPFLFTVTPEVSTTHPVLLSGDLSFARRSIRSLGPEEMEQSLLAQVALAPSWTLVARAGRAPDDPAATSSALLRAEVFAAVLTAASPFTLSVGVGGMRDYAGTAVALGSLVAGYGNADWTGAAGLRLERPFTSDSKEAETTPRDAIDVTTSAGLVRTMGAVRLGLEAVAEDLEGFFEADEAEGGAKLMIGPTLSLAPTSSRWHVLLGGGPVLRLTESTVVQTVGAPRDLTGRDGYVLRTSVGFRW